MNVFKVVENGKNRWEKHEDLDWSLLPDKGCVLGEDSTVILCAASDQDYENYMAVSYENSFMKSAFKNEEFKKDLWESLMEENAAKTATY